MYSVKIIKDSIAPCRERLTTFELSYPRMVHAELMTHRLFSRNSASSRAIPTKKLMQRVREDPAMPKWWGRNQKGMQAQEELQGKAISDARNTWLAARDIMLQYASRLHDLGLHKQIANRLLEPWMFITVIVTASEFSNWFHLRDTWPEGQPPGPAQPEIAWIAREMNKLYKRNIPQVLGAGQWHLPYVELENKRHPLYVDVNEPEIASDDIALVKVCVARCARVSYLTHNGIRDLSSDLELHDRLSKNGHWSPFEHAAQSMEHAHWYGNFCGWRQYRKWFKNEHYGKAMS